MNDKSSEFIQRLTSAQDGQPRAAGIVPGRDGCDARAEASNGVRS